MNWFVIFLLVVLPCELIAGHLKGMVTNDAGEPLPFASVYVKNTTYGVATNAKGEYFLELEGGTYTIVYGYLGYQILEKRIAVPAVGGKVMNVTLKAAQQSIDVDVVAEREDVARKIMTNVRAARKGHLERLRSYSCDTYVKTVIEKELVRPRRSDTLRTDSTGAADLQDHFKKQKLNMIETISRTHYKRPARYKEEVEAHHDYAETESNLGKSVSVGFSFGEQDIIPRQVYQSNPYLIYNDARSGEFNFYKNNIDFPVICEQPLRSPIASGSGLHYKYTFISSFFEGDKKIYKLEIIPRNPTDALFSGIIYIQDSTWALDAVDLSINRPAMYFAKDFRIIQNYEEKDSAFVPVRREIHYTIRDGRHDVLGHTQVDHDNYSINPDFPGGFFGNQIKVFAPDATEKDSTFWNNARPVELDSNEIAYITESDSIAAYYASDEYAARKDSAFNAIDPYWFWLTGVGHRNSKKGITWFIAGVPEQVNPFGIGGYRHRLPGYFEKEFKNNQVMELDGFIDYGFNNKDVKGKLGLGWTYYPQKFVRTKVTVGSFYEMINQYAALQQIFSRSNYVHTKTFALAQRMEVINGLFAEVTLDYSDQNPISDLQLSRWSEQVFGELNTPTDFQRYTKSEIKLELKYRFNQKFVMVKNKKIVIGSDWPTVQLIYRKGMPDLFGSEVNFDFFEIGAKDLLEIPRWGTSAWEAYVGTFVNRESLRVLEHKYFRGSDRFLFSDPLRSFQLLGQTLNTRTEYLRGNYMHHFDGTILNKVPLLKRMRMSLAGGAGALLMNEDDFVHFELFGGVEKVFRIKTQLFRLGVYGVTANNALDKADFTIKVGLDFYDRWSKKWNY